MTIQIIFWIVEEWYRTSSAIVDCPLGIFKFCNVIDIDILFAKKSKVNAAFLIINE